MEPIRSSANAVIKRLRAAAEGRGRGLVLLEGRRLIEDARRADVALELIAVPAGAETAHWRGAATSVVEIEPSLFARLGSVTTTPDVLALAVPPTPPAWEALVLGPEALVVVAAGIQDPGNLGALARTAEAAGASALIVVAGGCRPDNPKALRGSMGSLFRLPCLIATDAKEVARELEARGVRSLQAATRGGSSPANADWSGRVALWLSSEAGEMPAVARAFEGVTIPLAAAVESLNVTQAAAVLLFAAGRTEGRS
ncbi:MAG: RNA methyltransferase [Planctomycetota bacterium]